MGRIPGAASPLVVESVGVPTVAMLAGRHGYRG